MGTANLVSGFLSAQTLSHTELDFTTLILFVPSHCTQKSTGHDKLRVTDTVLTQFLTQIMSKIGCVMTTS